MSCILCHLVIEKSYQRFLVSGKAKFNVEDALSKLPFVVERCSVYICRSCLDKLKKRDNLVKQEENLTSELKKSSFCHVNNLKRQDANAETTTKRQCVQPLYLSPIKASTSSATCKLNSSGTLLPSSDSLQPLVHSTPRKDPETSVKSTVVTVKLQWPSETRERRLPQDLESVGKMLVRGTYRQVANSVWSNKILRKEIQILALKEIDSECNKLCSKKSPSCLRSPSKDQMLGFSFETLNKELEEKAPFTQAVLRTVCVNKRNYDKREEWVPSVGMASAVLLRNRSSRLNAVQLLLSIFLYHSSWTVSTIICNSKFSKLFMFKVTYLRVCMCHK